MKTLPARPHEKADGSVAAFIPRNNTAWEIPRDFDLGVSTLLGHYRNYSFNLVVREILTLGEGFNSQVFTQSFNTMVRDRDFDLGGKFRHSGHYPIAIAYHLQANMAYIVWCFNMVFLRGAFTPNSPQERPRLSFRP